MKMNNINPIDIMMIEDNPADRELTIRALKKNNLANNLFAVEDGEQALDFMFCRNKYASRDINLPPKVIMLDLKLPKVDGFEVLRVLKNDQRFKAIPVVIVTSSNQDPDIKTAYNLGANSYVIKPVDFNAFADAVSKLGLYWLLINKPPVI
jgi:two-component system, response regulator